MNRYFSKGASPGWGTFLRGLAATLVLGSAVAASGGGIPPGGDLSPGEEVGSLPSESREPTGLYLLGSPRAIRELILDASGEGALRAFRMGSGRVLVVAQGNLTLRLDRSALAKDEVGFFFHAAPDFRGGAGQVFFNGRLLSSFRVGPADTLGLPIARVYGTRGDHDLGLLVNDRLSGRYGLFADAQGGEVALIQRTSL